MSVRLRLTLWYTGILALTLLVFGIALYFFLSAKLYSDVQGNLKQDAKEVVSNIQIISLPGTVVSIQLPEITRNDFKYSDIYLQSYTIDGSINRSSNLPVDLPFSKEAQERIGSNRDYSETVYIGKDSLYIYYEPLLVHDKLIGVLQVATLTNWIESLLYSLKVILTLLAFLTILIAASVGWFLARKGLQPIGLVIDAANQIEKGADLGKRITYDGPRDEIGRLTETINGMLDRIQLAYSDMEEAYGTQRRFVSDASHELRTPLTTIRGNVELLQKIWRQLKPYKDQPAAEKVIEEANLNLSVEALSDITAEAERMSRLVNDLLSLARADAGYKMDKKPLKLRSLVEEVSRMAQFLPKNAEFVVSNLQQIDHVHIMANKDYIQQLLFIFIENAFKYTDQGSVRVDFAEKNGRVGVIVSDTGIGMDKEEVPHIFERFYRADPSRGKKQGTGLGLSIAKWIIDEHQGSVEVSTVKNEGTTFTIWLPVCFP